MVGRPRTLYADGHVAVAVPQPLPRLQRAPAFVELQHNTTPFYPLSRIFVSVLRTNYLLQSLNRSLGIIMFSEMVLKRKRSDSEISYGSSMLSSPNSNSMAIDSFQIQQNQIATPSLFASRTRKRHRDNRPSETDVHRTFPQFPTVDSLTNISRTHPLPPLFRSTKHPIRLPIPHPVYIAKPRRIPPIEQWAHPTIKPPLLLGNSRNASDFPRKQFLFLEHEYTLNLVRKQHVLRALQLRRLRRLTQS